MLRRIMRLWDRFPATVAHGGGHENANPVLGKVKASEVREGESVRAGSEGGVVRLGGKSDLERYIRVDGEDGRGSKEKLGSETEGRKGGRSVDVRR